MGLAAGLAALVFILFPQLDLAASAAFHADGVWAPLGRSGWAQTLYDFVPPVGKGLIVLVAGTLALGWLPRPAIFANLKRWRRHCAFLLVAAALGQGLLVDQALKNHLGRARPAQVTEFGGDKRFTPALVPSDQCARNCSFASGHVAATAFLMGFGWFAPARRRRTWLLVSLAAASAMGLARVAQGGHFLSDALFAWFATYLSFWVTEWLFRRFGKLPAGVDEK